MAPPPRTLLVANPTAQSGKNAERIEHARELLDASGIEHVFEPTRPNGETVNAIASLLRREPFDTVIYMGGDGTFAEVAKSIIASGRADDVRLGMLPTGTANDQGKSFGLSSDPSALEANVAVIADARETRLDVGKLSAFDEGGDLVREDLFFDSAGWGISPRVLALRNEDRKAIASIPIVREVYRDQWVYAGALLRTFVASYTENDAFDVEGIVDGESVRYRGLTDLVVKGTMIYGGIWVLDPNAKPDDGRFELVPFAERADWLSKAIVHLEHTGLFESALSSIGVTHSKGTSGSIMDLTFVEHPGALPIRAQIDGEEFPISARVRIEVLPRRLRLIVPHAHATTRCATSCATRSVRSVVTAARCSAARSRSSRSSPRCRRSSSRSTSWGT
jgi:diacylglycerol kinase family enzyme